MIEGVIRKAIHNSDAEIVINVVAVTILLCVAAPHRNNSRRVELILQGSGLTSVTQPKYLIESSLLMHLPESVCNVVRRELFPILKLDELFTAVSSDKNEYVAGRVCEQPLVARRIRWMTTSQEPNEIVN